MTSTTPAHCNNCGGRRNHHVRCEHEKHYSERIDDYCTLQTYDKYSIVECCGCGNVSIKHIHTFSEDMDEQGREVVHVNYYPKAYFRRKPAWTLEPYWDIPSNKIKKIHDEIYSAMYNDCGILAMIGIRSLLEAIMIGKCGDNGSFANNIKKFYENGHISNVQKTYLETTIDAGHSVTHRGHIPSQEDLSMAIDITENIIETTYISPARGEKLRESIPPRKK